MITMIMVCNVIMVCKVIMVCAVIKHDHSVHGDQA